MITLQQGTIYLGTAAPASGGGGSGDAVWGSITGTLSNQTDLATALAGKQGTLTAGTGIDITNNVISATGGGSSTATSVENKNTAVGATNPLNFWEGTSAEYDTGGGSQTWYNWQSGDSASWTEETSPSTNKLLKTCYANNKYIIVGESGTILSSSDGSTWTSETSGVSNNLNGVAYGNNKFIVVGNSATILSSSDGITWTSETSTAFRTLYGVTYGNGLYVIVGLLGVLYTSPDGSNWTERTSNATNSLNAVTYGNNLFVAVGADGNIVVSSDGINWSKIDIGISVSFKDIIFANNKFIAVADSYSKSIFTSTDGSNWSNVSSGVSSIEGIAFGNNEYIAVSPNGIIYTSSNTTSWEFSKLSNYYQFRGITYGNDGFVAVGFLINNGCIVRQSISQSSEVFTTDSAPTTLSQVYSAPNTTSALTITSVGTGTITLSDTNTYDYNASGNQTTTQTVGDAHPDWICLIEGVGIKKGSTTIA